MASNRSGSGGAEASGAEGGVSRGQPLNFKVVLLGEGAVGKTSLVLRYVENNFNDKHLSTLQVCMGKGRKEARGFGGKEGNFRICPVDNLLQFFSKSSTLLGDCNAPNVTDFNHNFRGMF